MQLLDDAGGRRRSFAAAATVKKLTDSERAAALAGLGGWKEVCLAALPNAACLMGRDPSSQP